MQLSGKERILFVINIEFCTCSVSTIKNTSALKRTMGTDFGNKVYIAITMGRNVSKICLILICMYIFVCANLLCIS